MAVLLREGLVCLGSVVEDHWVAVAVQDAQLGDLVVVAAYLPPLNRGGGAVSYCEYRGVCWRRDVGCKLAAALLSPALSFWVT